jgi:hypothetical protein
VVHSKANRSEQAVTRKLSKVLSIVIVFIAKNNRSAVGTEKEDKKSKKAKKNGRKNRQKKNQQRKPKKRQRKAS